jgi:hypothetical protein
LQHSQHTFTPHKAHTKSLLLLLLLLLHPLPVNLSLSTVQHGDHYHAVYHQPSYGHHHHGWGRKLMGVDSAQKVDGAQHGGWGGGWGNYGGYGGGYGGHSHGSGHWDMGEWLYWFVCSEGGRV